MRNGFSLITYLVSDPSQFGVTSYRIVLVTKSLIQPSSKITMTPFDAALWAFVSAVPLLTGALITRYLSLSRKIIVVIMAFGSGSLISVVTFSLMGEAYRLSGIIEISAGFFVGALSFTYINHRFITNRIPISKLESNEEPSEGSGTAMALGSLMDNIPEGLAIGISLIVSGTIGVALVSAIAVSNFSESVAGSNSMQYYKKKGRFILGFWCMIMIFNIISATLGFFFLEQVDASVLAIALSLAAGAILAMLVETMIPEVFKLGGPHISIATAAGFLFAFLMVVLNGSELRIL